MRQTICSKHDFYDGVCPAIRNHLYCNSEFPCSMQKSVYEYEQNQQEIFKAKALLKRCGYTITKQSLDK